MAKSDLWNQLLQLVEILDEAYKFAQANTPNFLGMEAAWQAIALGDNTAATAQRLVAIRSALSALIASGPSLLSPVIAELARVGYGSQATSLYSALDDIYQGMIDAEETVKYRNFTFGAVAAAVGNNGDGTVYRVTRSKDDIDLEGGCVPAGITRIRITADQFTGGTAGAETYEISGEGIAKTDELYLGTCPSEKRSGIVVSHDSSLNLASNGGFETQSGTAPAISVSGWTLSAAAAFDTESSEIHRGSYALKFVTGGGNANVLQYLSSSRIDKARPVIALVRYNREAGSGDGTLTLRLGTKTVSVALSAQTGWNTLVLGAGSAEEGWYSNFKEDYLGNGIRLQVSLTDRTGGYVLIDDVIAAQPALFDGKYYFVVSGEADYLVDDEFIFTDSVVNTGRTQLWIARIAPGKFLPHTSGTPTYADV